MILLVLGLLLAALVALPLSVALAAAATRRSAPMAVLLVYLLPAVALAGLLLLNRDQATRLRFALLGFGFRAEAADALEIEIGGDPERSAVWVAALGDGSGGGPPAARLRFRPAAPDADIGALRLQGMPAATGFIGWRPPRGRLTPLPAVQLADGDRLHLAGRVWTVHLLRDPFGPPARFDRGSGPPLELPPRRAKVPLVLTDIELPVARPLPASEETFALAHLEQVAGGALPSPLPRAFLFRQPGLGPGGVFLASPDGSAAVERQGRRLPLPAEMQLDSGDTVHVLSFPRWNEAGFAAGGVRDRRSFRADVGRRGFTLELETKEVYALPWRRATLGDPRIGVEDLALPAPAGGRRDAPLKLSLAMGSWEFLDRNLHFEHAGQRLAAEGLAIFELPRRPGSGGDYAAATPRGHSRGIFGRPHWLGRENLSAVQLDVLRPPVWLGVFAIVVATLKATAARSVLTRAHLAFAAALEGLLVLRLLLGFRAWAMDPFSDESYRLALIAWMLLPWGFLAAALPAARHRSEEGEPSWLGEHLLVYGGLLLSAAWCLRFGGGGIRSWVWGGCHMALAILPWLRPGGALWETALPRWLARRGAQAPGSRHAVTLSNNVQVLLWTGAGFVLGWQRFVLLLLGAKESFPIGTQRFALTLLHVPLAAILLQGAYAAWVWRRTIRRGRLAALDLLPGLAFLLGSWVLPAPLVSDFGLALLNVPVLLVVLALLTFTARRRAQDAGETGWRLTLPPAVVAAALVACFVLTAFPAGARAFATVISRLKGEELVERNYLRLLAYAYPEKLEQLARRSSEEMAVMNAVMARYTTRPWTDCRYFGSEISPHLRPTALREHAVAVLLAPEWGLPGVLALFLFYCAAGAAGLSLAPWRDTESWGEAGGLVRSSTLYRCIALFAGLTFALPSVYMVLANYRLTLFTGKNPYLLGLDSTADVLESLVLAALFAAASTLAREREDAP